MAGTLDSPSKPPIGEHDSDKALHYSEGKPGVDQIPVEVLLEWGEVFSYGEKKYDRANWLKGNDWHQFQGSALRHIYAFWRGEDIDPESGLPHLSHALWNIGALRYYQIHGIGNDDRPIHHLDLSGLCDDDSPQYICVDCNHTTCRAIRNLRNEVKEEPNAGREDNP